MLSRIGNRKKIILSTLFMVLLIWGVQGNVSSVEAAPDLGVATPIVSPSSVAVGGNFTLSVTVTNGGDTVSPPATVIYYRSIDSRITTNDEIVGSKPVSGLAATTGSTSSFIVLIAPPPAGTYYYGAYVTPVSGETATANNITATAAPLTVTGGDNLSVTIYSSLSTVAPQQTFNLIATVRNNGKTASSVTTLQAYQRSGSTNVFNPIGGTTTVQSIGVNSARIAYIELAAPSSPGIYSYRVQIVSGTTKISNVIFVTVANPVDLSVNTPTVDKSTVAPGETFTLTTTVSNVGTASFTGSNITLRYFRSTDTTLNATDDSDTQIGTDLTATISASSTTSGNITLTATAPSEQGTYYYYAYVVPVPGEQYYYGTNYGTYDRTANNTSAYVTVTVSAPPDLTVSLFRLRQATFAPGERFTLDATVRNSGTGASAATQLRVYEDSDDRYRREQQITRKSISAISANGSSAESIQLTAPTEAGIYYYRVYVEPVTGETATGNNYSNWVGIEVVEPLVLESLQASKVALAPGESFTLTATVKNSGDTRYAATTVRYYRSNDNSLSSRDTRLGSSPVSGIAAGGTTQVSTSLTAPQARGTYYYGACVGDSQTYSGDACEVIKITVVKVTIAGFQRPPMYWVDAAGGTLQSLTGSEVDPFVASVRNATAIAIDMVGGKVYWAEGIEKNRSRVRRANLNGKNVEIVKEMGGAVRGLAIDSTKGHLYMTNARPNGRGNIQRSKLDGSRFHWNYIDNLSPVLSSPRDIALDVAGGKVYWTEDITDAATGKEVIRIRRANRNGKNVEVVREISGVPRGLAVDAAKGNLYLANTRGVRGNIQRLKVDGSLFHWNYIHIAKADSPQGVVLDTAGGKVYWTEAGGIRRADLNGKNRQDVATGIGSPAGIALRVAPVSTAAAAPAAAAIVPNATALLTNYPNPFNPETWIPYQLQKAADVNIAIYDQRGVLVRQLSLGHQVAGHYVSRSRAAFWDGRNQVGEPVASGLYFYTLTAGDFSATRKMLIVK